MEKPLPNEVSLTRNETTSERKQAVPQFLAGISANILAISIGAIMGWTSSSIFHLEANDTPIPITTEENSWIQSLMPLAAAIGPFAAGYSADAIGRKRSLLLAGLPITLAYVCLAAGRVVWLIYVGRFVCGFFAGWGFTVLPMYLSEIAEKRFRGAMGTLLQLFISFGLLFDYCIGPYVPYMWLSIATLAVPVLFMICFVFAPESPYFLLMKGKGQDAAKALKWLRGNPSLGVDSELETMRVEVEEAVANSGGFRDIFSNKVNIKSFALCMGMLILQQLSGISLVQFNAQSIFLKAGGSVSADVATIIIGIIFFLATFPAPLLVERLGRKVLLVSSAIGMTLSHTILGLCFYLDEHGTDTSGFSFLPVVSLVAYFLFYSPGYGPLPWAVMGEMFPANIRAVGATLGACSAWLTSFILSRFYNNLVLAVGDGITFWIFAGCCAAAGAFVFFLVPETKGKTVAEIQKELS